MTWGGLQEALPGSFATSSFPSLFQAYCDKNYPPTNNQSANAHHKDMADKYVDAISKSLQEFQTGIAVGINEKANQVYLDLACGGLYNTPIFDATYPSGTDRELTRRLLPITRMY